MKKFTKIGFSLAAALMITGAITTAAFAASVPGADVGGYSYNTGKQSYEARMAEDHSWYDNEDDSVTSGYSFNAGSQSSVSRNNTFAGMPEEENMEKEAIEAWFDNNGLGEGSAWSEGQFDESAVSSYGYSIGQAAYQQRHAAFAGDN